MARHIAVLREVGRRSVARGKREKNTVYFFCDVYHSRFGIFRDVRAGLSERILGRDDNFVRIIRELPELKRFCRKPFEPAPSTTKFVRLSLSDQGNFRSDIFDPVASSSRMQTMKSTEMLLTGMIRRSFPPSCRRCGSAESVQPSHRYRLTHLVATHCAEFLVRDFTTTTREFRIRGQTDGRTIHGYSNASFSYAREAPSRSRATRDSVCLSLSLSYARAPSAEIRYRYGPTCTDCRHPLPRRPSLAHLVIGKENARAHIRGFVRPRRSRVAANSVGRYRKQHVSREWVRKTFEFKCNFDCSLEKKHVYKGFNILSQISK